MDKKEAKARKRRNIIRTHIQAGYRLNEKNASKFYKMVLDETDPARLKGLNSYKKKKK